MNPFKQFKQYLQEYHKFIKPRKVGTIKESISIIGAGNLAWHLAYALETEGGVAIEEIYSRELMNAKRLVSRLYQAKATNQLDFSESRARLFILAVPDLYIGTVAHALTLPSDAMLIHTSGSQSISVLEGITSKIGVLYPLQTFSKQKEVDFSQIPFFIEGNSPEIIELLSEIAGNLSKEVYEMNSLERKKLHLGAVFACNFTNHLLSIAYQQLKDIHVPFEVMHPIIVETLNKALEISPIDAQTGPAKRRDINTIEAHIELLENNLLHKQIYHLLTESIQEMYHPQPTTPTVENNEN
jgi:predicted short-subunit dehydrogenase-like oxidoreductase (DUF2520 family)